MDRSRASCPPRGALSRRRLVLAAGALGLAARAGAADPAQHIVRPWPRQRPVPPLGLEDLDGRTWELSKFKGRPALLNFWATWCEPCRAEMPSLDRIAKARAADGLVVLAIDYQEGESKIRDFLKTLSVHLPVLLDRDGAAARAWTPRVFPSTVLIDRKGQPVATVIGELDWGSAEADRLVKPLLEAPG